MQYLLPGRIRFGSTPREATKLINACALIALIAGQDRNCLLTVDKLLQCMNLEVALSRHRPANFAVMHNTAANVKLL